MRIFVAALLLSGFPMGAYADGDEGITDRIRKAGNVCIKGIECVQAATPIESVGENIGNQSATAMESVEEDIGDQSATAMESVEEEIGDQTAAEGGPVIENIPDQSAVAVEPVSESIPDQSAAASPVAEGMDLVKENYAKTCGICHDAGVANAPKFGDAEQWASRIIKGKDRLYMSSIIGMPPAMPARGMCFSCSDDDLKALVDYMVEAATVTP